MKYFFENFDEKYISLKAMRKNVPALEKMFRRMDNKMRADFVKTDEFKSFFEHKTTCSNCNSICCVKGPCGHSANDFDFFDEHAFDKLRERIDLGQSAISVHVGEGLWSDNPKPAFTLTERVDKGSIINFEVPKGKCSKLTPDGCAYTFDERPTIALMFVNNQQKRGCRNIMDMRHDSSQWIQPRRQETLYKLTKIFYDSNEPFKKNFIKTVDQERDMALGRYIDSTSF